MPVKTTAAASGSAVNARISSSMNRSVGRRGERAHQRAHVIVEELGIAARRWHAEHRWRELHDHCPGPPCEQLRCVVGFERLVQDHLYLLLTDRRGEPCQPSRAWAHAFLRFDNIDDVEA